ncbi:diaminopimelate epimerase [Leeia oryzae]|uniref:diaminopimelate epimerase n=1 Tax=Leeia oryzae TaxID=356662 RepID=UPI000377FE50|nr:diaminopimelate epimerase [Leeia oryzae]
MSDHTIPFTKMQGLGNDFVVLDGVSRPIHITPDWLRQVGDRKFGVGFDQLLLVEKADDPAHDFKYRIFNCDGTEVEQCGNGARCFARFVVEKGLTDKQEILVETAKGVIKPRLVEGGLVTVDMGAPQFNPADIPFLAETMATTYPLTLADGTTLTISAISMGNPHAVTVVDNTETAPVAVLGPQVEYHPQFPARVNAGFMQIVDRHEINLRVYERGAGETLACGTGACAAVVAGISRGLLDSPVKVNARGGQLSIAWAGNGSPVMMTGPAVTVFEGQIVAA